MPRFSRLSFRQFLQLTENNDLGVALKSLYDQDQAERQQYQTYLARFPDWEQTATAWARNKQRSADDVFDDATRLQQAKQLITQHIEQIKLVPSWLKMAWLLVQHMDDDIQFQQWFLQHLRKNTINWRYLTDRILMNQGQRQKYGTQAM